MSETNKRFQDRQILEVAMAGEHFEDMVKVLVSRWLDEFGEDAPTMAMSFLSALIGKILTGAYKSDPKTALEAFKDAVTKAVEVFQMSEDEIAAEIDKEGLREQSERLAALAGVGAGGDSGKPGTAPVVDPAEVPAHLN